MADRVAPLVRLGLVVRKAVLDLADGSWILHDPLAVAHLPAGQRFPYREPELWVYAQLTGGPGRWELAVEVRPRRDVPVRRDRGDDRARLRVGPAADGQGYRLRAPEVAVPRGLYEFRVIAQTSDDTAAPTYEALNGPVAELRVLDPRGTL